MTEEIKNTLDCPYCHGLAVLMTTKQYYGKDYGTNIYVCKPCDATVGTHRRTDKPKGTLARKELRELRKSCHSKFDTLWKKGELSRKDAYKWLEDLMELSKEEAHIALFDEETCQLFLQRFDEQKNSGEKGREKI